MKNDIFMFQNCADRRSVRFEERANTKGEPLIYYVLIMMRQIDFSK